MALSGLVSYALEEACLDQYRKYKCAWIKIDELGCCGKPCTDVFCYKHISMRSRGSRMPLPCLVCGIGVINFHSICRACSLEEARRQHNLILAKEFENYYLLSHAFNYFASNISHAYLPLELEV